MSKGIDEKGMITSQKRMTLLILSFLLTAPFCVAQEEEEQRSLGDEIRNLKQRVATLEEEAARQKADDQQWRFFWNRGLNFENEERSFTVKLTGKIHSDWALMSGDRGMDAHLDTMGEDLNDRVEFRRARITLSGRIYERYIFKGSYDFAHGNPEYKDVYVGVDRLCLDSHVRVGYFKEPFSLESVTAEEALRFIERSLTQALAPSRNTGFGWNGNGCDGRVSWGVGSFYNTNAFGDGGSDGDLSATARLTGLPWYEGDDNLVHLGAACSRRGEDDIVLSTGPEVNLAPDFVETVAIDMDHASLYGGEAGVVLGAFSAQGEYVRMDIDAPQGSNPTVWGYNLGAGYFLTGEHRRYDKIYGRFGRVIPESDFLDSECGTGAWEIAARCSRLDLDDRGILSGGTISNYTVGVNWYLTPSIRILSNYIHSHLDGVGSSRILLVRFALLF